MSLTQETQNRIKQYFQSIGDFELNIETLRQNLAALQEFEPYAAYMRLDQNGNKAVSAHEVRNFLAQNQRIHYTVRDCEYLIKYFDIDGDGVLSYTEFMQMVLPCDNLMLRSEASQRPTNPASGPRLPEHVERALADFLEREVNMHMKLEMMKKHLIARHDWDSLKAYNAIDITNDGYLNHRNIQQFQRNNGHYASDQELIAIVRRLDADADQRVIYQEFCEAVQPIVFEDTKMQQRVPFENRGGRLENDLDPARASPLRTTNKKSVRFVDSQMQNYTGPVMSEGFKPLKQSSKENFFSPTRSTPAKNSFQSPLRQSPGPSTLSRTDLSNKYRDYQPQLSNKTGVTRQLFQGSAKKADRMQYADAMDHSFNSTKRFTAFDSDPHRINTQDISRMPPVKNYLPRVSPLNNDDEDELITLIKDIIEHEREREDVVVFLSQQSDFNLMDAFQMIDIRSQGWLTAPQLQEALQQLGEFYHKDDVYTFVRRFDRDSDGRLLFSDFCDAFTPHDSFYANSLSTRAAQYIHRNIPKVHFFARETRDLILRCFRTHFEIEESIELVKKRLARRPKFNVRDAFKCIDVDDVDYLTKETFKRFLHTHKCYPTESEMIWLNNRFDRNNNSRISFSEFAEELMPKNTLKS